MIYVSPILPFLSVKHDVPAIGCSVRTVLSVPLLVRLTTKEMLFGSVSSKRQLTKHPDGTIGTTVTPRPSFSTGRFARIPLNFPPDIVVSSGAAVRASV